MRFGLGIHDNSMCVSTIGAQRGFLVSCNSHPELPIGGCAEASSIGAVHRVRSRKVQLETARGVSSLFMAKPTLGLMNGVFPHQDQKV